MESCVSNWKLNGISTFVVHFGGKFQVWISNCMESSILSFKFQTSRNLKFCGGESTSHTTGVGQRWWVEGAGLQPEVLCALACWFSWQGEEDIIFGGEVEQVPSSTSCGSGGGGAMHPQCWGTSAFAGASRCILECCLSYFTKINLLFSVVSFMFHVVFKCLRLKLARVVVEKMLMQLKPWWITMLVSWRYIVFGIQSASISFLGNQWLLSHTYFVLLTQTQKWYI